MVILRPTRKLHAILPVSGADEEDRASSDTALGDWYINRIVVDRRPLLLVVSSTSLLALVIPARDVRSLPNRLPAMVSTRLRRLGVDDRLVRAEVDSMSPATVAKTSDRSVLGIMVDFAKSIPYCLEPGLWDDRKLVDVEDQLACTPCYAGRRFDETVWPERKAPELLQERWGTICATNGANGTLH